MSCYHPIKAFRTPDGVVFSALRRYDILGDIEVPCGQCIGCRMRRASDWAMRVMHEAACWEQNCFVTLTYGRDKLPANGSLDHRDFELFMKRLRKAYSPRKVRFFMCGEYGEETERAHYHACIFNVDFRADRVASGKSSSGLAFYDSAELRELWTHGRVSVQDLTKETAGYCARYVMKKVLGQDAEVAYSVVDDDGVIHFRKPPYMVCSKGIGEAWFDKFHETDVFRHDFVVHDGVKRPPPKYYDKLYARKKLLREDEIKRGRELRAVAAAPDNTDERRVVRETVQLAKFRDFKRGNV